jgi:regulator of protease activity HflC (stomatin/prohibitin superfamily)
MDRNVKKIGLANLLVLFVVAVAALALALYAKSLSGQVGTIFMGLGLLVLAVSYFQMRMEESERIERMEFDELTRAKGSSSLFNVSDAEVFPARRAREQFERFFVPAFTIVLLLLQGAGAWLCWQWLKIPTVTPLNQPAIAMSLFALFALTLFLLGKYSAGIARLENNRLVRPGASYLLLGAYISFLVAASVAGVEAGFPRFDLYAARALGVVLGLAAVENLINLVLEIYRPRTKAAAPRLLYDGRLIGLLSQPEGIFTTAAHALDYQFGFKVSETWVYRFLEKAFAWILLLQLGILALSTCVVFIAPGEQGLLERWGSPVADRGVLNPGIHFKMPYPIDVVYRARTDQIQELIVGNKEEGGHEDEHGHAAEGEKIKPRTIVWTVAHDKDEFNLLVASRQTQSIAPTDAAKSEKGAPVDLLSINIPVQYRIKDIRAWTYHYTDAGALLEKIATREVVRYLVSIDLMKLLSTERANASRELRRLIQERADQKPELGVEILNVGLQDIHPPVGKGKTEVAKKFEEVVGARQEAEKNKLAAEGYKASVIPKAHARAAEIVQQAEANKIRTVSSAEARAARFKNQIIAQNASPNFFLQREYLQAFTRGATNARKYIFLGTNNQDIIQMNLEDKIRSDLLDTPLPAKK